MRYIVAMDSFKGSLTSEEAGKAVADNLKSHDEEAEIKVLSVSDGGEGMLDAFCKATHATRLSVPTRDALMRRIEAQYAITPDGTAIIEVAQACGLMHIEHEQRNPMRTTSYGVGLLVADALRHNCHKMIIGLGGSATSDAGIGMLRALIDTFAPEDHFNAIRPLFDNCEVILASDVTNPLYGINGAAHVFAKQKGATSSMIETLDARAKQFALHTKRAMGFDKSMQPGAGAAGGLGYAFMQFLNAKMQSGAELLLHLLQFDKLLAHADIVITGEGKSDCQTLMGKLPAVIMQHARQHHLPTLLLSGQIEDHDSLITAGFKAACAVTPCDMPLEEAMIPEKAKANIRDFPLPI